MADVLQRLYKEYKIVVSKNVSAIGQFESAFRVVSYVIAGRFEDSTVLSELLYSVSNLLVLFNDAIIQKASGILPHVPPSQERLKNIITILEYVGVFVEVSADRMYGDAGRWVAIAILQITKCVCRFLLFVKHGVGIQAVPPLSPIDREAIMKQSEAISQTQKPLATAVSSEENKSSVSFVLKRSGKAMRTLSTDKPVRFRDWRVPTKDSSQSSKRLGHDNLIPSKLSSKQAWGEVLYIFKPIIHLGGLLICGQTSFKPWIISSGLDMGSLCLLGDSQDFNALERTELRRRALMLAMYLLRSPFYDRYSKQKLLRILRALCDVIPVLSIVLVPLIEYLPVWQRIYFYTWST